MAYYLTIKKGKEYKKLDVTSLDADIQAATDVTVMYIPIRVN